MKHKFALLDGLRGLAAIAVVMFHADATANRTAAFAHGYLAVDFFFMLSGFILAYNYQDRLDEGWPTKHFLTVRWIRLYPLYFLGLIFGTGGLILKNYVAHTSTSTHELLGAIALGALLLPIPLRGGAHGAFPLNYPAWSLFAEATANVFHALFFRKRTTLFMMGCFTISAALTTVFTLRQQGLSFGFHSSEILLTIPRVLMSYTAGILVFRFWAARRPAFALPGWIVCALLLVPLVVPRLGRWNAAYDLLIAIAAFPALLIAGASAKGNAPSFRSVFEYAGKASYAIYILHIPLLVLCTQVANSLRLPQIIDSHVWTDAVFPLLALAVATIAHQQYDEPIRIMLSRLRFAPALRKAPAGVESTL